MACIAIYRKLGSFINDYRPDPETDQDVEQTSKTIKDLYGREKIESYNRFIYWGNILGPICLTFIKNDSILWYSWSVPVAAMLATAIFALPHEIAVKQSDNPYIPKYNYTPFASLVASSALDSLVYLSIAKLGEYLYLPSSLTYSLLCVYLKNGSNLHVLTIPSNLITKELIMMDV